MANEDTLIEANWLAAHLGQAGLKAVDASWYLPTEQRDPEAEYLAGHIPGAVRFDIDAISDRDSPLPHMFPSEAAFAEAVGALGISNEDHVVCYDGGGMAASGRAWWMFRAFGHRRLSILNGGSRKWRREGHPFTADLPDIAPATYEAHLRPELLRSAADVMAVIGDGTMQILDARAAGRFAGTAPEPRQGLRSGHMPGACNLPYTELLAEDGTLKPLQEVERLLRGAGLTLDRPVVASCGSGVSATVPLLGLHLLGHDQAALYDGSWSEWGSRDDTPVVT